ncbi:hypothetical protein P9H17_13400 [Bacillus atrophaeus]|nr:hypothetical protein [Bacillus atrophaeus]MCM3458862.1 hypothetical protein [Bacillus atrophaeus]MCY8823683.1 hypothetical protein [Bacillus atrophaeus]MEC0877151.1 hypothetical protein [Bacillus atrophaeus]MEC0990905.1 hypothetical protein [Bacillus atrophaeus]MEC1855320.1 hypothetical protein [Bacillus atrophaeus]
MILQFSLPEADILKADVEQEIQIME